LLRGAPVEGKPAKYSQVKYSGLSSLKAKRPADAGSKWLKAMKIPPGALLA